MLLQQPLNILNLFIDDLSPANRAPFHLGNLIINQPPVFILFCKSLHKPVAVDADEVELVVALVHAGEVDSLSEFLVIFIGFSTFGFREVL